MARERIGWLNSERGADPTGICINLNRIIYYRPFENSAQSGQPVADSQILAWLPPRTAIDWQKSGFYQALKTIDNTSLESHRKFISAIQTIGQSMMLTPPDTA